MYIDVSKFEYICVHAKGTKERKRERERERESFEKVLKLLFKGLRVLTKLFQRNLRFKIMTKS